jgi:hypothetical protein
VIMAGEPLSIRQICPDTGSCAILVKMVPWPSRTYID